MFFKYQCSINERDPISFRSASSLYLPYLTLQMQQVGLDIEEIAIIYSVLPFVTCVMPPLAGWFYLIKTYTNYFNYY